MDGDGVPSPALHSDLRSLWLQMGLWGPGDVHVLPDDPGPLLADRAGAAGERRRPTSGQAPREEARAPCCQDTCLIPLSDLFQQPSMVCFQNLRPHELE